MSLEYICLICYSLSFFVIMTRTVFFLPWSPCAGLVVSVIKTLHAFKDRQKLPGLPYQMHPKEPRTKLILLLTKNFEKDSGSLMSPVLITLHIIVVAHFKCQFNLGMATS
jgi:hypothetical protein